MCGILRWLLVLLGGEERPLLSTDCAHGLLCGTNFFNSMNISLSFIPILEYSDSWLSYWIPYSNCSSYFSHCLRHLIFPVGLPWHACPCSPRCRRWFVSLLVVTGLRWHDTSHMHQKKHVFLYFSFPEHLFALVRNYLSNTFKKKIKIFNHLE